MFSQQKILKALSYFEALEKPDDMHVPDISNKAPRRKAVPQLKEKTINDIAIYIAIYLSKEEPTKLTFSNMETVLHNKNFVSKVILPVLEQNNKQILDMDKSQKKALALKVQTNILQHEKETIMMVSNFVNEQRRRKATFIYMFNESQLKVMFATIKQTFDDLATITSNFDESDFLNYTDNINKPTYIFMNNLINKNLSDKVATFTKQIIETRKNPKLSDTGKEKVDVILRNFKKASQVFKKASQSTLIWVQADDPITDMNSLEKYFNQLEDYREKAEKIIDKYKKLKDVNIILSSSDKEKAKRGKQ